MYKLVILIEPQANQVEIENSWPEFLHHSERMPGLVREATSQVDQHLYGNPEYRMVHELFFNSPEEAHQALNSDAGKAAGRLLQLMTGGSCILFFADHKEDELSNIRKYQGQAESPIDAEAE